MCPLDMKTNKPYVFLATDRFDGKIKDPNCKRHVLYIGGFDVKYNGRPNACKAEDADVVVFNSKFYAQIALSSHLQIKKHRVIYILAPMPADHSGLPPVARREPINGQINFVAIAKWWKRPFKRHAQIVKLFNNYVSKRYPNAVLHMLGCGKNTERKDNIIYYHKSFHSSEYVGVFKNAHVQIMLSPLDAAPKTLTESLYYRVPFICSNNCMGPELIRKLGKCGRTVEIDPPIQTVKDCTKYKPYTKKRFYNRKLDYDYIMQAIEDVVENYEEYTSWKWTEHLSIVSETKKWKRVLSL